MHIVNRRSSQGVTCPTTPNRAPDTLSREHLCIPPRFSWQSNALLSHNFSVYGQDTWKLRPRLTVTYGLRWDINTPLKGKTAANQPYTVIGLNDPATMTLAPRGTPLYQTKYGSVAPRLGLAYQFRGPANSQDRPADRLRDFL